MLTLPMTTAMTMNGFQQLPFNPECIGEAPFDDVECWGVFDHPEAVAFGDDGFVIQNLTAMQTFGSFEEASALIH